MFQAFENLHIDDEDAAAGENITPPASAAANSSSLLSADSPPFVPTLFTYPRGFSSVFPPPGFPPRAGLVPTTRRGYGLFDLMTSADRVAELMEVVRGNEGRELRILASHVTRDRDIFLEIAENKTGSSNLRKFLRRSSHVNSMLFDAVISVFLPLMKLKYGHYVATQTLEAVDRRKKILFYSLTESYALDLASDENGCVALNEVITAATGPYRNQILDLVAENVVWLSMDTSGNFVVQHVLNLHNPFFTGKIAMKLHGHYVLLSSQKYGSYIVEMILDSVSTAHLVLDKFIRCRGHELMRLARNEFGNYVLQKALKTTYTNHLDLYRLLVAKLEQFLWMLRRGHGKSIVALVERLN